MADVIPSTMPPKLPPQTKPQVLAWFFGIAGVSFSVPLLWVITVRFVAHADVILGLGATILSLLMLYTNIRLRKWVKRTRADFYDIMLAMDWIMFGSVCTSLTNNVSLLYYEPKPMLGDLGFYLLPEILPSDPLYVVSDIFVDCLAPMVLIYCVFVVKDPYERSVIGRRCFARVGTVQLLRCFTTAVTRLPGPALHCRPGPHLRFDAPTSTLEIFVQFGHMIGAVKNCGDLIFSGHSGSLMSILTVLVPAVCAGKSLCFQRMIKSAAFAYATGFALFVIACRKHYTVDVIVAYMLVLVMRDTFDRPWQLMRSLIPTCALRHRTPLLPTMRRPRTKSNLGVDSFDYNDQSGTVQVFETRSLNV